MLPHGDAGPADLLRRVIGAEEFYGAHGTTARFQICPPACSEELDGLLAGRGYRLKSTVSLQTAPTASVVGRLHEYPTTCSFQSRLDDAPTRVWFDVWCEVRGDSAAASVGGGGEWDLLGRAKGPCGYASVALGDRVVAVGRAVVDTGWAGVFSMATLAGERGKGAAWTVLAALADWSHAHGAEHMYLQVERENIAALHLYERAGFSELCAYHYRTKE